MKPIEGLAQESYSVLNISREDFLLQEAEGLSDFSRGSLTPRMALLMCQASYLGQFGEEL